MTETIVNPQEEVIEPSTTVEEVTNTAPQPGEKTDPALLLKSLQEERDEKRRERELRLAAEERLRALETAPEPDVYSDEGQALKSQLKSLEDKIALKELADKFPQLKDKAPEFEDYRTNPANAGMSIETAAKAFLVERDLLVKAEPRKGLETDTGGGRAPVKTGMTEEEKATLRTTNFREYSKRLKNGTLN